MTSFERPVQRLKRFMHNNCAQCWNCGNREGVKPLKYMGEWHLHPVCSLDGGVAMCEVYFAPCPKRKRIDKAGEQK